ncbi:hypothetical protein BKA56DRAFT_672369 [Ilyonectria sp. MPI-CAGE-AT-0026]|nr:hypothetical protein BKA56DRAFT_672369 [Ilyonectria sp. MPI-CAGE-AT-0026]
MLSNDGDEDDELPPDEVSQKLDNLLLQETEGRGRPKALCYEDILMIIVRHPETGQTIPAMAIKFVHHKGSDRKPKPTIFFFTPTKMLLFCPVSIIIALALHDQAFAAPSLTTAARVLQTRNQGGTLCTPLRWKESMLKVLIFRRLDRNGKLSGNEAMLYASLRDAMMQQSLDAGYEQHWTPKYCRRGAANSANGNASDAVRDQMMRYDPKFATFHGAYLNERVDLTRDPRATRDMVPQDVWANQQPDPEIMKLEQRRVALKGGTYQRNRQTVKDYCKYYFHNRPTWDIERQARGEPDEEYIEPAIELNIPERAKLADLICKQPADFTQDEMLQKRIQAIDLIVALYSKRETSKRRRIGPRVTETPIKNESPGLEIESYPTDPFPLLLDVRQYPNCFGDKQLTFEECTFRYYRPRIRDDHFDNYHLPDRECT